MAQQRNNEDISYTSDKTFLSLEVVGLAEAVVTRLLHERKSLENIDMVLKTYREVLAQFTQLEHEVKLQQQVLDKACQGVIDAQIRHKNEEDRFKIKVQDDLVKASQQLTEALKHKSDELEVVNSAVVIAKSELVRLEQLHRVETMKYEDMVKEHQITLTDLKEQQETIKAALLKIQLAGTS